MRTQNGGQLAAFRDGFAAGNAPFVTFLDADDVWLSNFLVAHLSAHLNAMCPATLSSSDVFWSIATAPLLGGTYILLRKPRPDALGATITASNQLGEMGA